MKLLLEDNLCLRIGDLIEVSTVIIDLFIGSSRSGVGRLRTIDSIASIISLALYANE